MVERAANYPCAYTHKEPSRDPELELLLRWLSDQPGSAVAMVGPVIDSVGHSTLASRLKASGVPYVSERQLAAGRLPFVDNRRLMLLWPTAGLITKVEDEVGDLAALGVLTWNLSDVEQWRRARQALDVLGLVPVADAAVLAGPVLCGALISLTESVSPSTGLTHPLDWDQAVLTFRRLRASQVAWVPADIEAWAIANGWQGRDAADLRQVAEAIAAGRTKRLKTGSHSFPANVIEVWREIGTERMDRDS